METAHKRPNYILIWVYLAVLTAAELALAFELPISRNLKLLLLLFLAVWKAALVGLFFMHLKFERWNLRIMAIIPLPLAVIFILDRKSTRLNSSHLVISYAVFCLKKKKTYLSSSRYRLLY